MNRLTMVCLLTVVPLLAASSSWAQGADPLVDGSGTATLERKPELLRLQMEVYAVGKDAPAALEALKARQDQVRAKLIEMGAAEASIAFDALKIAGGQSDQHRQMQRLIMARMRSQGRPAEDQAEPAEPVKLSMRVKAEWPLNTDDYGQMLVFARELSGKIKDQDLSGRKDMEKLSEAEQEMLEEAESSIPSYYDPEEASRGEPVLLYVVKLTDKDRATLLQQAYAKAKADAERLAEAAGRKLGELRQLRSGGATPYDPYAGMAHMYAGPSRYQLMQLLAEAQTDDQQSKEAFGTEPGPVMYRVAVSASFVLSK